MASIPLQGSVSNRLVAAGLALWGGGVAIAASTGLLAQVPPRAIAGLVVLGVTLPTLAYATNAAARQWVENFGIRRLTLFHSWRIVAAILFFGYSAAGLLPPLFVERAAWGDLIAGLLAVAVVAMPFARWRYAAMHVFGSIDFVTAVGTGLYFTLSDPASMLQIRYLPLALIPMFGVALSGATHLIAFDLLRRCKTA
ncbi:MAG: hypothetical protein K2Y20_10400 [Sphingomonas sp.]|nr:hypothetical protein [Sphingomonas sp.]